MKAKNIYTIESFAIFCVCMKCTVEEAHDKSYPNSTKIAGCMQIHNPVTNAQHQLSKLNVNDNNNNVFPNH